MIHYSLPEFNVNQPINMLLLELMRSLPEVFFDDVEISSFFGNFPGCIMNGGRIFAGKHVSPEQIRQTFDTYEKAGKILRLTCTNMLIRPEQFGDEYCNVILTEAQKHHAEVIVWSDELADYIADRYHLRRILSTTRKLDGVEELNRMLDRYDMVVLDYNRNKDDDYLKKVSDPSRLEVMPNELCKGGCPHRQTHYEHDSRAMLNNDPDDRFLCRWGKEYTGFTRKFDESPVLLSNKDIRRLNAEYGISNFKLVGRHASVQSNMESYLYYLVRPEYRSLVYRMVKDKLNI